jgi:hypothetical protein
MYDLDPKSAPAEAEQFADAAVLGGGPSLSKVLGPWADGLLARYRWSRYTGSNFI